MKTTFSDMTSDLFKMLYHLKQNQMTDENGNAYLIISQNSIATTFNASIEDANAAFKYFKNNDYLDPVKGSRSKYVLTDLANKFLTDMECVEQAFQGYVAESIAKQTAEKKAAAEAEPIEPSSTAE